MALILESGTGSATANAFVNVAAADAYHSEMGHADWAAADTADKEAAIIRATAVLSSAYAWKGTRRNGRDQALSWPRYDVADAEGWPVPYDAVPREIADATCIVALQELTEPGSMSPVVVEADRAKRLKAGSVEIEYANAASFPAASRPVLVAVSDMIGGLLDAGANNRLVGRAVRA